MLSTYSVLLFIGLCAASCPPVTTQTNFNVTEYANGPWYAQMQMPIKYLPLNEFYCVRANYTIKTPTTIAVNNYANIDEVNGKATGGPLCAVVKDTAEPAKLSVGPCPLPKMFYGPYWVLLAGPDSHNYEYALISGGQPTIETGNGCKTGDGTNNSGLWIFSRTQVAPQSQIDMVVNAAADMGFDTSVLYPVEQEGCIYPPV